jgi:hypothetical protein
MSTFIKQLNTVEAETNLKKHYAALNASTTNAVNKTTFSNAQQTIITRAAYFLSDCYCNTKPYVNYRKTKASIKLVNKNVSNKSMLCEYEDYLFSAGWGKTLTPQGIIYSIKKANLS